MIDEDVIDSMGGRAPLVRQAIALIVESGVIDKQILKMRTQLLEGDSGQDVMKLAEQIILFRQQTQPLYNLVELGNRYIKEIES